MFKAKVSYVGKKVSIGIDVHKKFFVLTAVCDGEVAKACRIPAEPKKVADFIRKYFEGASVKSCYEAGFSGFGLHRALTEAGLDNIVVHAAAVEVSSRDRVKTDKRDSKKLALQLASDRLQGIRIPTREEELARVLSRSREQLMRSLTRCRVQIRMKLHQFGLMDGDDKRVLSRRTVKEVVLSEIPVELKLSIEVLLSSWENALEQKRLLENELRRRGENDPIYRTWMGIPGMGPLSSRVLADELGDMSQFQNEGRLFSFTGLTPAEYSSGEKIYRGHISRQGSGRLRRVLVEAAWRAIRKDPDLRAQFERIAARAGKKRAIVAVARKLVGRARAVFRKKEDYQLNHCRAA